jgi:hypothetical protein
VAARAGQITNKNCALFRFSTLDFGNSFLHSSWLLHIWNNDGMEHITLLILCPKNLLVLNSELSAFVKVLPVLAMHPQKPLLNVFLLRHRSLFFDHWAIPLANA